MTDIRPEGKPLFRKIFYSIPASLATSLVWLAMLAALLTGSVHGTAKLVLELAAAAVFVLATAQSVYLAQRDTPHAERRTFYPSLVLLLAATGMIYLDDFGIVTGDRHGYVVGVAGAVYLATLGYMYISAGVFGSGRKAA